MLTIETAQLVDRIITDRITLLKEIIRTGNEGSATGAVLRLVFVGTKESADALMDLAREIKDPERSTMIAEIIPLSLFASYHKEELMGMYKGIGESYKDVAMMDDRLINMPPLWKLIADAIDDQHTREQYALSRAMEQNKPVLLED